MRTLVLVIAIALPAAASHAQLLTSTPHGVAVAHGGRIALGERWRVEGVQNATAILSSDEQVVVLDAIRNEAVAVDVETGRTSRFATAESPIAGAFLRGRLWVLARDARVLDDGTRRVPLSADPAFVASAGERLYVYSRAAGILEEFDGTAIVRRLSVPPFASDLEISGTTAWLVYPREARIRTVDLRSMKQADEISVGAVPVDIALAGGGTALTARLLAVADPSAKRVWVTESSQSTAKAFARGFLRGFIGLGLFGSRSSEFPTGIDRVMARGSHRIAYDTSSRTLYRFDGRKSSVVATGVPPGGFALTPRGVAWWDGTSVAEMPLR